MRKGTGIVLFTLLFAPVLSVSALDWGLLADQSAELKTEGKFTYSGTLLPWFSMPLGEAGKLYLSAGATVKSPTAFVPELLRTELNWQLGSAGEITAGRIRYTDPLGFIASGLFDGARFTMDSPFGVIGVGLLYTGLQYKENAQITMTGDDMRSYGSDLDYGDFAGTYFASSRLIAALEWDNSNIQENLRLRAAVIGQFDMNNRDSRYHSQYLTAKLSVPVSSFVFDAGACIEAAEMTGADTETQTKIGFAGELEAAWLTPSPLRGRLTFTGRYSTGNGNADDDSADGSTVTAFVPVTTEAQGNILQAKLSGLSMLRLDYTVRPIEDLICSVSTSYFILSDATQHGHFLGDEFFGRVTWVPFSDLRLSLGGGVFLPALGNADPKAAPQWRAEINAVLVIF